MSNLILNPHLTKPQGEALAKHQADTVDGMAHWAGSGPEGVTCRECDHWGSPAGFKRDPESAELLPRRCQKFTRLMAGLDGPGVPHRIAACRHFEKRDRVPPVLGRKAPSKSDGEDE